MSNDDKLTLVERIVDIENTLASACFSKIGSVYYTENLEHPNLDDTLGTDSLGRMSSKDFSVGPTTDRNTFDNSRGDIDFDRGPCENSECVFKSNMD